MSGWTAFNSSLTLDEMAVTKQEINISIQRTLYLKRLYAAERLTSGTQCNEVDMRGNMVRSKEDRNTQREQTYSLNLIRRPSGVMTGEESRVTDMRRTISHCQTTVSSDGRRFTVEMETEKRDLMFSWQDSWQKEPSYLGKMGSQTERFTVKFRIRSSQFQSCCFFLFILIVNLMLIFRWCRINI